jgi:hypothetical protein
LGRKINKAKRLRKVGKLKKVAEEHRKRVNMVRKVGNAKNRRGTWLESEKASKEIGSEEAEKGRKEK